MWRWLKANQVDYDLAATRAILPTAMTVPEWLHARSKPAADS